MKRNIDKFSLAQLTSNTDGKTSASGTLGALTIFVGLIGFLAGVVDFFIDGHSDIMIQSVIVLTVGCGLLGFRKSQEGSKPTIEDEA